MANHLRHRNNLTVPRTPIAPKSADLVCLDWPFTSNADYNQPLKAHDGPGSAAQIEAFDDIWH